MDGQATGIVNSAASPHGWTLVQSEARRQPVSRDAWLWQNDELSDGTLFLVRKAPPSFNACTEASIDEQELPMKRVCMLRGCCAQRLQQVTAGFAPRPPDYVSRFKVHKTVYSAASGFFKACFAANGTPSMAGHGWPVWCDECMVSTLTMSDPELEVAEHVFKFMYTLKLPTGASGGLVELDGMQLVWMIQVRGQESEGIVSFVKSFTARRTCWQVEKMIIEPCVCIHVLLLGGVCLDAWTASDIGGNLQTFKHLSLSSER